jgi:hypothetical protein
MRWSVVSVVWLHGCCVPLPFPHDHDDTPDDVSTDDLDRPPRDTDRPPPGSTASTGDTADDCLGGLYEGPTLVDVGSLVCTDSRARLSADLLGWTDQAVVFLQETNAGEGAVQWSEEHPLTTSERDACGFDEIRSQEISSVGVPPGAYVPGEATVFPCAGWLDDPGMMTVAVYVEDVDDGAPDCLAFGHDPAGLVAGDYDDERIGAPPSFDLSACVVSGP